MCVCVCVSDWEVNQHYRNEPRSHCLILQDSGQKTQFQSQDCVCVFVCVITIFGWTLSLCGQVRFFLVECNNV